MCPPGAQIGGGGFAQFPTISAPTGPNTAVFGPVLLPAKLLRDEERRRARVAEGLGCREMGGPSSFYSWFSVRPTFGARCRVPATWARLAPRSARGGLSAGASGALRRVLRHPPRASARATGDATKNTAYADRTDADDAALVEAADNSASRCRPASNGLRFCGQTLLFRWRGNAMGGRR